MPRVGVRQTARNWTSAETPHANNNRQSYYKTERVVTAYEKGEQSIAETAARFSVGQTFLKKMLRQKRESGSLERLPSRVGAKKVLSEAHRHWLSKQVKEQPDATLVELQERLQKTQKARVSRATVSRELQVLRLPRKKSRSSPESATIGSADGSGGG
jgi:transposase